MGGTTFNRLVEAMSDLTEHVETGGQQSSSMRAYNVGNQTQEFDVCIVGSGAAGGFMAKELCEGGAKVVMLEGGKEVRPDELISHKWPYELPFANLRGEKQAYFYQGDV